jgi:SWI/SNF-related matrix-associated actin-dependent regulator of chromatin subfamily A member 5
MPIINLNVGKNIITYNYLKLIIIKMNDNLTESLPNMSDDEKEVQEESIKSSEENNIGEKQKEKKQLAEKIRRENENFMKSMQESKIGRLKFLLNQTEIFAHFLVGNKQKTEIAQGKKDSKTKRKGNLRKENIHLIKTIQEDGDEELEAPQVTRLYYQPSILTGGKLTDYQLDGLNWLISLYETGLNGILADEMGLGKTIQSIAFMSFLKQYKRKNGYFLVVVPKSTMPNWSKELKLWCPSLNAIVLNPVKEEREETLKKIAKHKFEVLITSYEGVNICISKLKKIKWECMIIDEAHRIKNENALLSKNVRAIESKFRLLVTGTPLQNNLHELWALLNFLLPDLFSSSEDFDEWFGLGNKDRDSDEADQEERNAEIVQQLHKILKPFLLRRTKSEVEKTLPPKKEIHIKVGLTEIQKNLYKKLLTSSLISESKTAYKNIIMQLRKCCNHPYLFDGVEEEGSPELGDHLITNSSKMRILDKLLTKLSQQKSQVLIFSQMTRVLDILEDYCRYRNYTICRIDGETSLEEREVQIAEFTKANSPIFLFLLSTRAGGLGLNLMTADTVILFDSDWNPQVDLQAMDRVHRIGQTKPVLIYRMICENTIEEKIIERQAMRLKLDSLIIQQGRILKGGETFTKDQMKEMIQYGADAIFRAGEDFRDEDIEFILERGEKNTNAFYDEAGRQAKDRSMLINMSFNSTDLYKFENEDYLKKRKEESEKVISLALAEELENDNRLNRRDRTSRMLNYNIDHNFDQLLAPNKGMKKKTRAPKIPFSHMYKNKERLYELKQKQINFFFDNSRKLPEKFDDDLTLNEGLDEEESRELNEILVTGFPLWDKKDYENLTSAIEKHGRNALEEIQKEVQNKTLQEVKDYLNAFWERINDLPDGARILKNVEKKERIEKQRDFSNKLIKQKVDYSNDDEDYASIKLVYPPNSKQSEFSYEEDQFLLFLTFNYGYGNWEDIVRAIRLSDDFMFNYYLKSRDKSEIHKRVDYLVKVLEREVRNRL